MARFVHGASKLAAGAVQESSMTSANAIRPFLVALMFALTLLGSGATANAATIFAASLTLDQEVGPPPRISTTTTGAARAASFGYGEFVLNDAMTALSMNVVVFHIDVTANTADPPILPTGTPQTPDINDNLVAAHIHADAVIGQPGTNAGVVWGFFGAPDHNNAPDDLLITAFSAGSPGPGGANRGRAIHRCLELNRREPAEAWLGSFPTSSPAGRT